MDSIPVTEAIPLIRGQDVMPWEFARPKEIDPEDLPVLVELARAAGFGVEGADYLEISDTIIVYSVQDPRSAMQDYQSPVRPPKVKPKDALIATLQTSAAETDPKSIAALLERQKRLESAFLRYLTE